MICTKEKSAAKNESLYSRYFLKRRELTASVTTPNRKRARISGQRISGPFPLRRIPRTALPKYLKGLKRVRRWMTFGMLSKGVKIPERSMAGISRNKTLVMACP